MAERVPQNGRYFQFLRIALISTFSRSLPPSTSLFFSSSLYRSLTLACTHLFPLSLSFSHRSSLTPSCALPLLLLPHHLSAVL